MCCLIFSVSSLQDHTFYLCSLVLIIQYGIGNFCLYLTFLPVTKLTGKKFSLSHYGIRCPFYWENLCLTLNQLRQSLKKYM